MKRIMAAALTFVCGAASVGAFAGCDVFRGNNEFKASLADYKVRVHEETRVVEIGEYKGAGGDVVVPGTVYKDKDEGKETPYRVMLPVAQKSNSCFLSRTAVITSFTFDEGVMLPSNSESLFANLTALKTVDFTYADASAVTTMANLFYGCAALEKVTLGKYFNSEKCQSFAGAFSGCEALSEIDIVSLDTDSAVSLESMFYNCKSLATIDISAFRTQKVTSFAGTFAGCASLSGLNFSALNTASATDMSGMLQGCKELTQAVLTSFDTSNVTNMSSMFQGCEKLKIVNVEMFDTSKVMDMSNMFYGCKRVEHLNLSGFDMGAVTKADNMLFMDAYYEYQSVKTIQTPKNVHVNVALPKISVLEGDQQYVWRIRDADSTTHSELIKNEHVSYTLELQVK